MKWMKLCCAIAAYFQCTHNTPNAGLVSKLVGALSPVNRYIRADQMQGKSQPEPKNPSGLWWISSFVHDLPTEFRSIPLRHGGQ